MEPRHLRYFVAVAEEGSLMNAAERRLHTAQPSLKPTENCQLLAVGDKSLYHSLTRKKANGQAQSGDNARLQQVMKWGEYPKDRAAVIFNDLT